MRLHAMTQPAAYDTIAERYRESKWLPFRHYIERHTIAALLGDLRDRAVLDLACDEGIYAREFKRSVAVPSPASICRNRRCWRTSRATGGHASMCAIAMAPPLARRAPGCARRP